MLIRILINYFNINQGFLESTNNDIKSRAIYLLGKFTYSDEIFLETSFEKLKLLEEKETDDKVLGSILRYSPMSRPNYHKIKIELG